MSAREITRDSQRSMITLRANPQSASRPTASTPSRRKPLARASTLINDSISVEAAVTSPALRSSISMLMIRRRTGWPTTCSASAVVNPVPVQVERA